MLRRRLYAARPRAPIAAAEQAASGVRPLATLPRLSLSLVAPQGIDVVRERAEAFAAGRFSYLSHSEDFSAGVRWNAEGTSPLWRYQLQYLGAVLDMAISGNSDGACDLLEQWCAAHAGAWDAVAWHPYPASLRLGNLCHAASALGSFERLGPRSAHLAATHAAYVFAHLEHDVRGNHLIENLRALVLASACFEGAAAREWRAEALKVLEVELSEQILDDGGHFELSPMYHGIVLWRLLEMRAVLPAEEAHAHDLLGRAITQMRRFLAGTLAPDGEIPLLGDSARGFGPPSASLALAEPTATARGLRSFPDTGLHVFHGTDLWAIFDAGAVCPDALPAHGQADSLTLEVWIAGRRIIGDPGVCEYTGGERAWGRSSRAHSTVTIDDRDTSEVYGSFRVGGRAKVERVMTRRERDEVTAVLVPFGVRARITRIVGFIDDERRVLRIVDDGVVPAGSTARSRLHLAPGVRLVGDRTADGSIVVTDGVASARITSVHAVTTEPARSSPRFGVTLPTTILVQELAREGARADVHGGWTITAIPAVPA